MTVVVLGSINMDLTTYVPHLPQPGETLFGSSFMMVAGGKGFNQAVAAGRLQAKTHFIGRIGHDAFGEGLKKLIADEPINLSGLAVDGEHGTGLAIINVDASAENTITVISGANMALDEEELSRFEAIVDKTAVLLLQLEIPLQTSLSAAKLAREKGVTVILDPAPAQTLPPEAYHLCHIMTPNESETAVLTGIRPTNEAEAAQAAQVLHQRGLETAVIKLGALGVYYSTPDDAGFVPAFAVDAIDTVAAGDAFNGGLAVGLAEKRPFASAIRWGAATGALATTKSGASAAMPSRDELLKLLGDKTSG